MLMDESELQFGDLAYVHRTVAFFDILGWRENIVEAGLDPRRIARLASMPRMFSSIVTQGADRVPGAHLTSFSDNVVASIPFDERHLAWFLQSLACIQFGAALAGFWLRGAVTVGELHHDDHVVFGPALNRAYYLESKVAEFPRMLLDPEVGLFRGLECDFVSSDDDHFRFVDPFDLNFINRIQREVNPVTSSIDRFNSLANTQVPTRPVQFDARFLLGALLIRLNREIAATAELRPRGKLTWLRDRVQEQLA